MFHCRISLQNLQLLHSLQVLSKDYLSAHATLALLCKSHREVGEHRKQTRLHLHTLQICTALQDVETILPVTYETQEKVHCDARFALM